MSVVYLDLFANNLSLHRLILNDNLKEFQVEYHLELHESLHARKESDMVLCLEENMGKILNEINDLKRNFFNISRNLPKVANSHKTMPKAKTSVSTAYTAYCRDSGAIHLIGNAGRFLF